MALDYKSSVGRYRRYLQLMQSRPLYAASLWTICSLILMIVLVTFALRPTLITIVGLLSQIEQQKELSTRLDTKIAQIQKATAELSANKERLQLLKEAIPDGSEWEKVVEKIQTTANDNQVSLSRLYINGVPILGPALPPTIVTNQSEKINLPEGIKGVNFEITASGAYPNLMGMAEALENMRRVIIFSNVRLTKNIEAGKLILNVKGQAIYEPPVNLKSNGASL